MPGLEGKTLGDYQLHRLIGRGGMADVYEGYGLERGRVVAVKVFKGSDDDLLRRFVREAHLMRSLHHEHLLPIYDYGQDVVDGFERYFIVMPLMNSGTLRARLRRSPLTLEGVCQSLRDIAGSLDYIHSQGVIHRDIKSSNVLLDMTGRCYLSDFGIARDLSESTQLTMTGSVLGTVDYVAPELFDTGRKADALSDLYSLGVLLFEMVTGQLPFVSENQLAVVTMHLNNSPPAPSKLVPHIPSQVDHVILRAMEKHPELRYPTATALANAFCRAITSHDARPLAHDDAPEQPVVDVLPGAAQQVVLPPIPLSHGTPASNGNDRPRPLPRLRRTPRVASYADQQSASARPERRPGRTHRSVRVRRIRTALIIALITLALLAAISIYAVTVQPHPGNEPFAPTQPAGGSSPAIATATLAPTTTPNLTATAQANAQGTATANAHATATAVAKATAITQANATATAGVILTVTANGKLAYQDALNDPNNSATQAANWDQNSKCVFSSGGYRVTEDTLLPFHGCRETGYTFQNAAVSVDLAIISGHSGGLFFRLSTNFAGFYNGYLFEVDTQGHYKVSIVSSGTIGAVQDWTFSTALKQGYNAVNNLQVIMENSTFMLYANGIFLYSFSDATYGGANDIGFLAAENGQNTAVVYKNLTVYRLS